MTRYASDPYAKNTKQVRKHRGTSIFVIFLFILFLTFACAIVSYNYVIKSSTEAETQKQIVIASQDEVKFVVPKGSNTVDIAELLKDQGFIKSSALFKLLSKFNGYDGKYLSGTHIISKKLSYDELMRVLTTKPASIKVTIPEGKNFLQIVDILYGAKIISSKENFIKTANTADFDYDFLKGLSANRDNKLEGYLFPDTYEFGMNSDDEEVITKMLDNFQKKMTTGYLERIKKLDGMTLDKIITVASVIEREAKDPEERFTISGVFYNRLKSKDRTLRKLQSCATIQYILIKKQGAVKERLFDADLQIDDPYNTYMYEGLPPGPICSPGEAAIKAALYPDTETNYLYFVAKGDGKHQFSKTFKEHQAAIAKYGLR